MHIDLNSCFASVAQQANPLLRGKPLVIAAYDSPRGCIVSPSIEAKQHGIGVGMRVMEARLLCPQIIVRTPDPPMIRDVHIKFRRLFSEYALHVTPKSIDEAVLDFTDMEIVMKRELTDIAAEIKRRVKSEIGEWIRCSVGIGPNRFLAKTAASLQKPDGLVVIDHTNVRDVYSHLRLVDLCGINRRFEARLNIHGIFSPLQFVDAPLQLLQKEVFQSINGYYWYLRLRGWEMDAIDFERKSYGQQYSLQHATNNPQELSAIIMKLCEKMGRRLRSAGKVANGIHVSSIYTDGSHWHIGRMMNEAMYSTVELYKKAQYLFNLQPTKKVIAKLSVSCYDLAESTKSQLSLFDTPEKLAHEKQQKIADVADAINDKYGELVLTPAVMMGIADKVIDRISFGNVKELEDLYAFPSF